MLAALTSWLGAAVADLDRVVVSGAAGATLGAIVGEFAIAWLESRHLPRRFRLSVLAAAAMTPTWALHMASLAVGVGLAWPVELWSGAVILSGLAAAALGGLAVSAPPTAAKGPPARINEPARPAEGPGSTRGHHELQAEQVLVRVDPRRAAVAPGDHADESSPVGHDGPAVEPFRGREGGFEETVIPDLLERSRAPAR